MSPGEPQFPEFGDGGDVIGARRGRRAFRWGVSLIAAFMSLLWVTEEFWRYPNADRLYLSALTLLPAQGRNLLRQAVIYDERDGSPSSKYLEALAEREEEDLVLSAYERAHKLDPENADLAIKFGCQLFASHQFLQAQHLFQTASGVGAHNALAAYLEASVAHFSDSNAPDFETAFAIIKQTNVSGDRVTFPRPMWFPSLRRSGYWYAQLRRQMVQHCGSPMEYFCQNVIQASEHAISDKHTEGTEERLRALETMGRRIALGAIAPGEDITDLSGGTPQLYLGLRTMLLAVEEHKRLDQSHGVTPAENLVALEVRLKAAMEEVERFESQRMQVIEEERAKYRFPFELAQGALATLFSLYLLAYLLMKILRVRGPAHNVHHSQVTKISWAFFLGGFLALLTAIGGLQRMSHGHMPAMGLLSTLWWALIVAAILVSVISPALTLPRMEMVLQRLPQEARGIGPQITKKRRDAYLSLVKRSFGIQFGLLLGAMCVWIIGYRIVVSLYPWMTPLLATGLEAQEIETVRSILSSLG